MTNKQKPAFSDKFQVDQEQLGSFAAVWGIRQLETSKGGPKMVT